MNVKRQLLWPVGVNWNGRFIGLIYISPRGSVISLLCGFSAKALSFQFDDMGMMNESVIADAFDIDAFQAYDAPYAAQEELLKVLNISIKKYASI